MTVEFLGEAEKEFTEAALWYESKELGLGSRFRDEVAHIVSRIAQDPTLWRERLGGYRRVNCPVFPYFVAYIIRRQKIIVVAVGHGHLSLTTGSLESSNSSANILIHSLS